jgi:aldose 1-epimerase
MADHVEPSRLPSGKQFEIRSGDQRAVATEVGATLRAYEVKDVAVLDGFSTGEFAPGGRGQVLAPWPNRLGGRYTYGGREGNAALDEPERGNAIHGLVRWLEWQALSHTESAVALGCRLHPQPGYPWHLEMRVEYSLDEQGMTVTTEATNDSDSAAPFGVGFHPYLTVGTPSVDSALLMIPAKQRLVADERALPVGTAQLAGTEFDFTDERAIGSTRLDTDYTDLVPDADGRIAAVLSTPNRDREVSLWAEAAYRHLMVFTGDTLEPPARRKSIAIEPMTCPPDALRSGIDLIRLEPGESWRARWGITHLVRSS